MFGSNRGDVNLPVRIEQPEQRTDALQGRVGVGTWNTRAEFKDISVIRGRQTLFTSDFSQGMRGWIRSRGQWDVVEGALRQSSDAENTLALVGDPTWHDYTLHLKARKISGNEGFLIIFQSPDDNKTYRWNLGGWNNTGLGLEMLSGLQGQAVPGRIEKGRWYDIRVELQGTNIKAYLDNVLIHDVDRASISLYAVAGRDNKTGETILKVVNVSPHVIDTQVDLRGAKGIAPTATAQILTSASPLDENSLTVPDRVTPRTETLRLTEPSFKQSLPAQSVTVFRIQTTS
jgi:alpha-L-arabinofuranosidase